MTRYLKINVGDTATITHTITNSDIQQFVELSGDNNRLHVDKEFANKTPLRRLAEPHDIADTISYLVSGKSDFLTGETIRVNGGQVMI